MYYVCMRVFFIASRQGRPYFDYYYQQILNFLDREGYENINKEYLQKNKKTIEEELKKLGKKGYSARLNLLVEKIHNADICIFECSFQSLSVGYLIEKALELDKPVVGLCLVDHIPDFLVGLENEKFQLVEYDKDNLSDLLKASILKAIFLTDKRFNFFISSNMLAYLNKVSKKLSITKSTFIRNLIEEYKKNNP